MFLLLILTGCKKNQTHRREISLNGTWEITKTDTLSGIPSDYAAKIPVPGLIDMAIPAIEEPYKVCDSTNLLSFGTGHLYNFSLFFNTLYWYRRTFTVDIGNSDIVQLKINKSMYHTRVFLNGKLAGENTYNFTPTVINIKPFMKEPGKENELVISVGCRNNLPDTVVKGYDFAKLLFTPGICDDVKLILSGSPFISNIQTVPDIENGQLRVVAEIKKDGDNQPFDLSYIVRESVSKEIVSEGIVKQNKPAEEGEGIVDFKISMPGFKLWSPENPFLYDLVLSTKGDNAVARFGMRTFSTGKGSGVVLLNGKTYYMRGTNVCIFRFFEDPERGDLPWNQKWVTKLHETFKNMHFNSMRYSIGFPPERWYEIADSVGFLIQDEYPIWTGGKGPSEELLKGITSDHLSSEYREWMRERWNHPCVVIWDAQNESVTDTTAIAINNVRALDLSNRPWDNGWGLPASTSDVIEAHPYFLYPYYDSLINNKKIKVREGLLKKFFKEPQTLGIPVPIINNPSIIINEYPWMWLNRDGSPTTLTDSIYTKLIPEADTPEKRFELYAKYLGMETEYWRAHRRYAGVLHFSGLSHSRPDPPRSSTSDNFSDVKNLIFAPYYYQYVRPAFNPVGIMINMWDEKLKSGSEISIPINLINDTYEKWAGEVNLSLINGEKVVIKQVISCELQPLGKEIYASSLKLPAEKGKYKLVAEINYLGESVKSIREFSIE